MAPHACSTDAHLLFGKEVRRETAGRLGCDGRVGCRHCSANLIAAGINAQDEQQQPGSPSCPHLPRELRRSLFALQPLACSRRGCSIVSAGCLQACRPSRMALIVAVMAGLSASTLGAACPAHSTACSLRGARRRAAVLCSCHSEPVGLFEDSFVAVGFL